MKEATKSIQAIVNFEKPLSYDGILRLLSEAIKECNEIFEKRWHNLPLIKRIFMRRDIYYVYSDMRMYCSYDGKAPMKFYNYILDAHEFPDAKYENRYLIAICGVRDYLLYFNVIPGIAEENQFGTLISEYESVNCITIKANRKSESKWRCVQTDFLEMLVPIIERINQEKF
jgi:hypothetical protein